MYLICLLSSHYQIIDNTYWRNVVNSCDILNIIMWPYRDIKPDPSEVLLGKKLSRIYKMWPWHLPLVNFLLTG